MAYRLNKSAEALQVEIENGKKLVEATTGNDVLSMQKLLESHKASVNADEYNRTLFYQCRNFLTPLQIAAHEGFAGPVELLIQFGADLNACDRFDMTPLHMAAAGGHLECLQLLVDAGANCNIPTKVGRQVSNPAPYPSGTTPLHIATTKQHLDCVKELIVNGADYNATNQFGYTSLYIASQLGSEELVLTHLDNAVGRDILSLPVFKSDSTPLHECVALNLPKAVKALIKVGSDPNHRNVNGYSPLHLAVQHSENYNMDIVKEIVHNSYNLDINLASSEKFSSNSSVTFSDSFHNGAPASNSYGTTALHFASFRELPLHDRRSDLAAFLIANGANFQNCKNRNGQSLLVAEFVGCGRNDPILQAITSALAVLPSYSSLDVHSAMITNRPIVSSKIDWYNNLCSNPRTLQHYCRCTIRKALGPNRLKHIRKMTLPTLLKSYLFLGFDV